MVICQLLLVLAIQATSPSKAHGPSRVVLDCGHWEPAFDHDLTGFPPVLPKFNAAHIALIPRGPHRGKLVAWDIDSDDTTPSWKQRWSIVDPAAPGGPTFENHELVMPADEGDLFCAGFAWTSEGDLLVVGGTTEYPLLVAQPTSTPRTSTSPLLASDSCSTGASGCCTPRGPSSPTGPSSTQHLDGCDDGCGCGCGSDAGGYVGGKLTYLWHPDDSGWYRQADLAIDRWYPTVTALGDGSLVVAGGIAGTGIKIGLTNNYEVFVQSSSSPPSGTWQMGPSGQKFAGPPVRESQLYVYPRMHLLTSGEAFMAGMSCHTVKLDHASAPGVWSQGEKALFGVRLYGSSALMPYVPDALGNYEDEVLILGGIGMDFRQSGGRSRSTTTSSSKPSVPTGHLLVNHGVQETVEVCNPTAVDPSWRAAPSMAFRREYANAVLLPDGALFVVGGKAGQAVLEPELFDGTSWTVLPPHEGPRTYHSTAALLPDARVLVAGGNSATVAYQVFVPSYLCGGDPRPVITNAPASMGYYAETPAVHTIAFEPMPAGHSVERAVLVTPAAVTHHTDYNQRYVQLVTEAVSFDHVDVRAPAQRNLVPPGYYMLFLVSAAGVPSQASWVQVQ